MTTLSPQARILVAKARQSAPLSVERRARIRSGLWAKLAVPAGLALSGSATAMGLFSKVILGVAAASVGLGGTLLVNEKVEQARREERAVLRQQMTRSRAAEALSRSAKQPALVVPAVPVVAAEVIVEPAPPSAPVAAVAPKPVKARARTARSEEAWTPELEPDEPQVPSPARSVAGEPAPVVEATPEIVPPPMPAVREQGPSLEGELRLLNEAQRAVTEHDAEMALKALEQYAAQFPHGNLREESLVLNVVALCELERSDEAKAVAKRLIELSPAAPVVLRVKASCAGDSVQR